MILSPTNTVITMSEIGDHHERSHRFGDKRDSLLVLDEETRDTLLSHQLEKISSFHNESAAGLLANRLKNVDLAIGENNEQPEVEVVMVEEYDE